MSLTKWVVGIDYSMTCPAITVVDASKPLNFDHAVLFYCSDKKPKTGIENITGFPMPNHTNNEERFDAISNWAVACIQSIIGDSTASIYIEDYSYGSRGKTFHIAENAGLVKHKLWKLGHSIVAIPPTVVKKFATGKGNATKDQMYAAFKKETSIDLMAVYQPKAATVGSPVGDLVDSYYICKWGVLQELNTTRR